jgi:HlyD family secretion protein
MAIMLFYLFFVLDNQKSVTGYLTSELIYISAQTSGELIKLEVKEGDIVNFNQYLFFQDLASEYNHYQAAKAQLEQAKFEYADVNKGRRKQEIDELLAIRQIAVNTAEFAKKRHERIKALREVNFSNAQELEDAQEKLLNAERHIAEIQARIDLAQLPGRDDAIAAAEWRVKFAEANYEEAKRLLLKKRVRAPMDGRILKIMYRKGEWINAGAPVIQFLDWSLVYLEFYLSIQELANINIGDSFNAIIAGTNQEFNAKIYYISQEPEFTPPVLYSNWQNSDILYKVKASIPAEIIPDIKLGVPVSVVLKQAYPFPTIGSKFYVRQPIHN